MLFTQYIRSPSRSQTNINQKFSFLDGFADQKEQKTMKSSQTKNTESETSCCDISIKHTEHENHDQCQFYSQTENQQQKQQINSIGINIKKQIIYNSPGQYRKKLQNLLSQINTSQKNKIFLRLLIVDKQFEKDHKLQKYFNWALDQYRTIKHQQITFQQVNSADRQSIQQQQ